MKHRIILVCLLVVGLAAGVTAQKKAAKKPAAPAAAVPQKNDAGYTEAILKNTTDKIRVVFLSARIGGLCHYADHNVLTGEPENLVNLVRSRVGDPRQQDTPSPS